MPPFRALGGAFRSPQDTHRPGRTRRRHPSSSGRLASRPPILSAMRTRNRSRRRAALVSLLAVGTAGAALAQGPASLELAPSPEAVVPGELVIEPPTLLNLEIGRAACRGRGLIAGDRGGAEK